MYVPSLFLFAFFAAFFNTADTMDVEAFLSKHGPLAAEIKKELNDKFTSGHVYRGETLELILAVLHSVQNKAYKELPASGDHHVRKTNNGEITPDQIRAEIKAFIKEAVEKPGHDAAQKALRAVVVGNVAYEECKEFLEKTLKAKVNGANPGEKTGKKHGQVHVDELDKHFRETLMHHETPELADAAAHFRGPGEVIPEEETPNPRETLNGLINEPEMYRTEIRRALESSMSSGVDLNGIAHAALERAEKELGEAKKKLVQLNAEFSTK